MHAFFTAILYQPIFNAFVLLYTLIPDIGVTIFLLTLIVKVIVYPFTTASIKAQKSMADLQPKLEAIKTKHKGNQQIINQETLKLYKDHHVNPFGACLPLIVQLLITISLYYVLRNILTGNDFSLLYPLIKNPGHMNTISLKIIDLGQRGNLVIALLAGLAQFWQAKMMITQRPPKADRAAGSGDDMMAVMNKQMLYMMPVMTVLIGYQLPAGLAWYWLISTVLTALQQLLVFRHSPPSSPTTGALSGEVVK